MKTYWGSFRYLPNQEYYLVKREYHVKWNYRRPSRHKYSSRLEYRVSRY